MNGVEQAEQALIDEFAFFDDWMDRYQYLIDLGRRLPDLAEDEKSEDNRIRGCQSQVWFVASEEDGRLRFRATSDAAIVRGLIAILLRIYDNRTPEEIVETPANFVEALGLAEHLSPTRSTGLSSMLEAIRSYARQAA